MTALAENTGLLLGTMIAASILGLIQVELSQKERKQGWGYANTLSYFRMAGSLALIALPPIQEWIVVAAALVLLLSDGLDGWIARRLGESSKAGALIDQEADALLMLTLCFLLSRHDPPGAWIIAPGLFRPLFVLSTPKDGSTASKNISTKFTRATGTLAPVALALLLLPETPKYLMMPVSALTTALLALSFLKSLRLRSPKKGSSKISCG